MHILVIGAAGMIGRKLVAAADRQGRGRAARPIERLTLADIVAPETPTFRRQGRDRCGRPVRTAA